MGSSKTKPRETLPSLRRSLGRIESYVAPHRRPLLGAVLLGVFSASLSALEPLVMKWLFDTFLSGRRAAAVLEPLSVLVGILLVVELLNSLREWLVWKVRLGIDFTLTRATVERLHSLPLSNQREQRVGALMAQVERGIAGCTQALSDVLTRQFPALVYLMVACFVMVQLEWRLALAVIAFAPLPSALGVWASSGQLARERGLMEQRSSVFARFNEVLTGLVAVKSLAMEEQEKRRFLSGVSDANGLVLKGVSRDVATFASKSMLMAVARLLALAVGGVLVMRGQVTLGTLVAFVGYVGSVFTPVQTLAKLQQTVLHASASLDAVLGVLDKHDSLGDAPDARAVGPLCGQVEFVGVSFMYRPERSVLKDVSLSVQPGEMVALVGPSGGGKTTLMALLQRVYDPTGGSISIDGLDIRTLKQRSLRDQIGVVLQEGSLFSATIRENITFGCAAATRHEIEAAARAANAHEFIMAMPQGYDTPVGERGERLSSGQRLCVVIARALLKNAPILVLDEVTAELDPDSEKKVQEALGRLTHGRTTFVIAERPSTLVAADRVAVFRDGTISELGTHEELMAQQGYYASFFARLLARRGTTAAA